MLQYLLNLSAVWLLSLVVFDVFLRRDTYHGYNRLYLLGTLAIGILLPLWSWQSNAFVYSNTISQPMIEQASTIRQTIAESGTVQTVFNWQRYLWLIYIAGAAISLLLLIKDALLIIRLYNKGDKTRDGVWRIIETGKEHTPFSAFRYVFINSKKNYSESELQMILVHEEQHGHSMHFVDLLFIQLLKIVFWFHPLVYMYYNRLVTVHEYQADAAVDSAPANYGQFIIEQAMLQSAPALTHSFNRSPIKKRIVMLTRKTSALAKSKQLVSIPLILVCILCFTKNAFSDDKKVKNGNKVTYKGNVIEFKEWPNDTVTIIDPSSGKEFIKVASREPMPISINGKKIYSSYEIEEMGNKLGQPANVKSNLTSGSLKEYLLNGLAKELKQLKDDIYYMDVSNVIVDEAGKIVYFDYSGIRAQPKGANGKTDNIILEATQKTIAKRITELMLNAPKHNSASVNGNAVNSLINNIDFRNSFTIQDGKLESL